MHALRTFLTLIIMVTLIGCSTYPRPKVESSGTSLDHPDRNLNGDFDLRAQVHRSSFIVNDDDSFYYPSAAPVLIRVSGTIGGRRANFKVYQFPPGVLPEVLPADVDPIPVILAGLRTWRPAGSVFAPGSIGAYYVSRGVLYLFGDNPAAITDRVAANGYGTYMVVEATDKYERVFFLGPEGHSVRVFDLETGAGQTISIPYHYVEVEVATSPITLLAQQPFHVSQNISEVVIKIVEAAIYEAGEEAIPWRWEDWLDGVIP